MGGKVLNLAGMEYKPEDFVITVRACPNNRKATATRDFGLGLGGEA
jgi:hypothetical protein